MDLAVTTPSL
ncbi:hypothetical protein TIFTF001_052343 [Ficus carica]|uniref:Uncharacterized protein n=1 Tax=Ficus carica TaxID=3494 RepID=A0AA88JH84_FICCA|nr:hypothetical protein TIFTF001_052343 [Ficus carica]